MKPMTTLFTMPMFIILITVAPAIAGNMDPHHEMGATHPEHHMNDMAPESRQQHMEMMDHSSHEMDMKGMHEGHRMGENIRNTTVGGYRFAYHLIDMREKMAAMKGMAQMPVTHHLMVYVTGPDGQLVSAAKAGYLVIGPDGAKQKLMCMGMGGGYGTDVNLAAKGQYTVKSKLKAGDHILRDTFTYDVQ